MAGLTLEARQALYEADIRIIDNQADAKIIKLGIDYHKIEAKHLAAVDKRKAFYQAKFETQKGKLNIKRAQRLAAAAQGTPAELANINRSYDNLIEHYEIEMEQNQNAVIEADMRILDPIEARFNKAVENVEAWRAAEKASESSQLEKGTQRPRRR